MVGEEYFVELIGKENCDPNAIQAGKIASEMLEQYTKQEYSRKLAEKRRRESSVRNGDPACIDISNLFEEKYKPGNSYI